MLSRKFFNQFCIISTSFAHFVKNQTVYPITAFAQQLAVNKLSPGGVYTDLDLSAQPNDGFFLAMCLAALAR